MDQIQKYIEKHQILAAKLHNFKASTPNLSKVPVERHAKVMANFYARVTPLEQELAILANKIKDCLNPELATSINDGLKKEQDAAVGEIPAYPEYVNKRHYELVEKLD